MLIFEEPNTSGIEALSSLGMYLLIDITSIPGPTYCFTQFVALFKLSIEGSMRNIRPR